MNNKLNIALCAYALMILFTFGRVYTQHPNTYTTMLGNITIEYGIVEKSVGSFVGSVLWPFYWSVQLWK